jgi:hypothetical protein
MASQKHCIKKVRIRGFRSIQDVEIDLQDNVNLFAGLNDHGKSNIFRAIHLFFRDQVEPGAILDYDRDVCRIRDKASKRIEIEIQFPSQLAHEKLLKSINRTQVQQTEVFAIRKVWTRQTGGFALRTDLVFYRDSKKDKRVYTDSDYSGIGGEKVIRPKTIGLFRDELERLFRRFRIRYLPSSTTGKLFEEAGLALEVKRYLFDSYSKEQQFKELGKSIKNLRVQFDDLVKTEFGDKIAGQLAAVFPELQSANLQLPASDEELVFTRDLNVHRNGKPVGISACGSGLQSILILETLKFLDSNISTRANDLSPVVIWLIEEPEAFLYEDLVRAVGKTLEEAAINFNVLATTHSRELVNSVTGCASWVSLKNDGTSIPKTFDLGTESGKFDFASYAAEQFGKSWLEIQYEKTAAELKSKKQKAPIIFVEGESDEILVKKLFAVFPIKGGVDVRRAITNPSSNAQHVKESVVKMSSFIPEQTIVGLFDNDHEGIKHYESLIEQIEKLNLTSCHAVKLNCPAALRNVEVGFLVPGGRIDGTGKHVNLDGVAVTIEALISPEILQMLKPKNYFASYWTSSQGGKQSEVIYTNLTLNGKGKKIQIAKDVAALLTKENAGDLHDLRNLIGTALSEEQIDPKKSTQLTARVTSA